MLARLPVRMLLIGSTAALWLAAGADASAACGRGHQLMQELASLQALDAAEWGLEVPALTPEGPRDRRTPARPCDGPACSRPLDQPLADGTAPAFDAGDPAMRAAAILVDAPRPRRPAPRASRVGYLPPTPDRPLRPPAD